MLARRRRAAGVVRGEQPRIAAATLAGSSGSSSSAIPAATSRRTGRSEQATGTPRAIASSTGSPNPSQRVALTSPDAAA